MSRASATWPGSAVRMPGNVLPQDHARGAEDAAEKGRRQVRAAAAERGDGPVGGAAEEARARSA